MAFVASCLLIALACAGTIIVILFGALYRLSVERNDANEDADKFEAEADGLQDLLNAKQLELDAALERLSRKRKPVAPTLVAAGMDGAA